MRYIALSSSTQEQYLKFPFSVKQLARDWYVASMTVIIESHIDPVYFSS